MKVMRAGRSVTVEVTADGAGLVSHAGTGLIREVADTVTLTQTLWTGLALLKQRRRGHTPAAVIRDLAVMLADGGECVADLGGIREQEPLFGPVASDSTAFRTIQKIAETDGMLDAVRGAHATSRQRFWELHGKPTSLTLDVDATLINSHSEKENAAGNYKGGYGFHPLMVYLDQTRECVAGLLRPGNAGSNTAEDHITVLDRALGQFPAEMLAGVEVLVRSDSAGATHSLVDYCAEAAMRFSVGHDLTEKVRAQILEIPVRRERPHPGAQLSFTDVDGYRFQAILTDQTDQNIAVLECRHRQHAHVEDRIRDDKDTGLSKFPFKNYAMNEVWLEIVALAHDLLVWTQALALEGQLAKAEPKTLRYRLLHVAGRLAFSGRRAKLHLQNTWPWTEQLLAAFRKLGTLTPNTG